MLALPGLALGLLFTRWAPAAPLPLLGLALLLARYQFRLLPVSQEIERAYEAFFFQGRTLDQLPPRPLLALSTSNLQTGRPFTFSRDWMGDSTYTYADRPARFVAAGFPVARAVAASSCVPFAFTPVRLARTFYQQPADADRPDVQPQLIDGGVYDNQGLHKLTQPGSRYACGTILVSDAGAGLGLVAAYPNTVALLLRTVDLFMQRIRNVQLMDQRFRPAAEGPGRSIAYLALDGQLEQVIPAFVNQLINGQLPAAVVAARQLRPEWQAEPKQHQAQIEQYLTELVGYAQVAARDLTPAERAVVTSVGTNLTPLTPAQMTLLSRHAENLTELQVKLYWPAPTQPA
ncbi:patatin-like phospholipase family protein [Hymenobacter sp. IS2118]|uniref:patatin-like phospholipase family protein n=1 Tax=Hymenobacter sp. IS2118 TaxID=1505605 RepID=UPI0005545D37|nr:patatin-like phospholipase family protein [Hymenobacter sp. IS2118]